MTTPVALRERLEEVLSPGVVTLLEAYVTACVAEAVSQAQTNEPPWLTLDEAAARLGCSRDAVRMRVNRGRLVARRSGRRVYVSRESVDRL